MSLNLQTVVRKDRRKRPDRRKVETAPPGELSKEDAFRAAVMLKAGKVDAFPAWRDDLEGLIERLLKFSGRL